MTQPDTSTGEVPIVIESCRHALKRLDKRAIAEKLHHVCWATVHPGHAGFPTLYKTKEEAEKHKGAYIVCRVAVIPLYGNIYAKDGDVMRYNRERQMRTALEIYIKAYEDFFDKRTTKELDLEFCYEAAKDALKELPESKEFP